MFLIDVTPGLQEPRILIVINHIISGGVYTGFLTRK